MIIDILLFKIYAIRNFRFLLYLFIFIMIDFCGCLIRKYILANNVFIWFSLKISSLRFSFWSSEHMPPLGDRGAKFHPASVAEKNSYTTGFVDKRLESPNPKKENLRHSIWCSFDDAQFFNDPKVSAIQRFFLWKLKLILEP